MSQSKLKYSNLNIVVIGCGTKDQEILNTQLSRLGNQVTFFEDQPDFSHSNYDLIFLDADNHNIYTPNINIVWPDKICKIALNSIETPSRLKWLIKQDVDSYLRKPIRFDGILTAIILAQETKATKLKSLQKIEQLELRLKSRKFIIQTQIYLMQSLNITEEHAYQRIRSASMFQQKNVETFCTDFCANPEAYLDFLSSDQFINQ